MKNYRTLILSAVMPILFSASLSYAQSDRAFVSTTGVDSPTCGDQTAPCRDFNAALPRTNAGGEIIALDSGIYGMINVTINKALTLAAAPGVHVDLYNTSDQNRVTITAGTGDIVVLRNLYITGKPTGTNAYGVGVGRVGSLQIENCVIDRFSQGIGSNAMQDPADFFIKDTIIKNSLTSGMEINTSAQLVRAVIDHCQFINNGTSGIGDGLTVSRRARVSVRDSVANGNRGAGFLVIGGDLSLENCESSNNDYGVFAGNGESNSGTAIVSNSLVTNNLSYGFRQSGTGVLDSLGNNVVRRNGTNTTGTITVITGT